MKKKEILISPQRLTTGLFVHFYCLGRKERAAALGLVGVGLIQDIFISSSPHCTWKNWSWLTGRFTSVRVWKARMNNLISLCWLWNWKNKTICGSGTHAAGNFAHFLMEFLKFRKWQGGTCVEVFLLATKRQIQVRLRGLIPFSRFNIFFPNIGHS